MRADIDRRIEKNNSDIEQLKADARMKKKEARREYDEKVNDLESRNHKLRERYDASKAESKDDWENFKKEFNHDMDELGNAIQDLFRDNKKNK
jgi:F0F1-type ATP synthase membrane subunit b/b'